MEDAVLGPNGWECDPTRGPYKVYADVDPVTGGVGISAGGRDVLRDSGVTDGRALSSRTPVISNKMIGLNVNVNSAAGRTWCGKHAVDTHFDAIRLAIYAHDITGPAIYQAIVAATETADFSDASTTGSNTFDPIVGGVNKRAVIDSTSDAYGWRNVTWTSDWLTVDSLVQSAGTATATLNGKHGYTSGDTFQVEMRGANQDTNVSTGSNVGSYNGTFTATATSDTQFTYTVLASTYTPATGRIQVQTNGVKIKVQPAEPSVQPLNAATCSYLPTIVYSDWIPVKSCPRADGGTLPLLMYRINVKGGTSSYQGSSALMRTPSATNFGRIFQGLFLADASGVYVTTPATWTPAPGGGLNDSEMSLGISYMSRSANGVTVMMVGDSETQNTTVADVNSFFGRRAANALSDLRGIAVGCVNAGASAQTTETYLRTYQLAVDKIAPQIIVYSAFSPNDHNAYGNLTSVSGANYLFVQAKKRLLMFLGDAKKRGAVPVIWTGLPTPATRIPASAVGQQVNALLKAYNAEVMAIAAAQGAWGIDMYPLVTDNGANDATYGIDRIRPDFCPAGEPYPNGLHLNDAGTQVMADALLSVLKAIVS